MTAAVVVLNPAAQAALAAAEQRIERALKSFVDMGQALTEIRDGRLYKATHGTFEAYCQERWEIGRDYADRMIAAAQVVLTIVSKGLPAPTKESQARALVAVPEADRAEVWAKTVERTDGKPTAAAIREVHEERTRPPSPGPTGAAQSPPADPGTTPAPAGHPPDGDPSPREPDPTPEPAGPHPAGSGPETPEPVVTSTAHPGSGQGEEAAPVREGPGAAAEPEQPAPATPPPGSPATWTDEQRAANQREVDRKRMVAAGQRAARDLVMSVRAEISTVVSAIDLGEKDLINEQVIADLRAAVDLLESRLEANR